MARESAMRSTPLRGLRTSCEMPARKLVRAAVAASSSRVFESTVSRSHVFMRFRLLIRQRTPPKMTKASKRSVASCTSGC